ncbi:MAG: FAD-dependent oxidoreductase [Candidatus Taylorbacteria bacterium]
MTYDLAIIGGGPAGAAAAVYAARKRLRTVVIAKDWIGQSSVSEKIENWVGTPAISGVELSKNLEIHAKTYAKDQVSGEEILTFKDGESCIEIGRPSGAGGSFSIRTDKDSYNANAVLIASGSSRRKLDVKGAKEFEHKGLTYCATCDGPMYSDQDVAVIGGGNAAFESAAQLLAYCKSVTLLYRGTTFKADPGTVEAVSKNPKMKVIVNAVPKEVAGDKFVTSFTYTDATSKKDITIPVTGIFVEIGAIPNTDFAKNATVKLNESNHVITDPRNQRTTVDGIWTAGDCTDGLYHQNNIAAGDAVKAIEDIYLYLRT